MPAIVLDTRQDGVLGPGGMTLRQEIGAVMMVGLTEPLTPAILDDWRQRQFGGLRLLPTDQHAADMAGIRALIDSVRAVMTHPLLAATQHEGANITEAAQRLQAEGFDIDLAPDADVAAGRSPASVAQNVTAAIAGIHAAGIYAVASVSTQSLQAQQWLPLRAAIGARVDMVMAPDIGVAALRSQLGFNGVLISGDLRSQKADAAVRFLKDGGDMVLISPDIVAADDAYDAIHTAVLSGSYKRPQLDASVQKLLSLGLRFMP